MGTKNVPTRTRILDIAILVGTFCPHNVGFTWTTHHNTTHTHTHTHTHTTHTHTHTFYIYLVILNAFLPAFVKTLWPAKWSCVHVLQMCMCVCVCVCLCKYVCVCVCVWCVCVWCVWFLGLRRAALCPVCFLVVSGTSGCRGSRIRFPL